MCTNNSQLISPAKRPATRAATSVRIEQVRQITGSSTMLLRKNGGCCGSRGLFGRSLRHCRSEMIDKAGPFRELSNPAFMGSEAGIGELNAYRNRPFALRLSSSSPTTSPTTSLPSTVSFPTDEGSECVRDSRGLVNIGQWCLAAVRITTESPGKMSTQIRVRQDSAIAALPLVDEG